MTPSPDQIKHYLADHCFGLPADQLRFYHELTSEQIHQVDHHFGRLDRGDYIYAIRRDGNLIIRRERVSSYPFPIVERS